MNPQVRGGYTTSRFYLYYVHMVIEYDLFNKIMHMYTVGKEAASDEAVTENNKEE